MKGATYKRAMPAWKARSDIRSEWGNQTAAIQPDTVNVQREATKTRTEPFKSEQELKSAS